MPHRVKIEIFIVEQLDAVTWAYARFNGGQSFSYKHHVGTAPEVAGRAGASASSISGESSLLDWWAGLVEVRPYESQSVF